MTAPAGQARLVAHGTARPYARWTARPRTQRTARACAQHSCLWALSLLVIISLLAAPASHGQQAQRADVDSARVDSGRLRAAALLAGTYSVGGFLVMDRVWYRDKERVPFHFFNDNSGYLQVDKFGHAFGAYVLSYLAVDWLHSAGLPRSEAVLFGGPLGLVMQTPIEVMDGLHEGWGFSWGDMTANAAGAGLVVAQELLLREQLLRLKFSYSASPYAALANGYLGTTALERLLEDYNGHTYWLSAPLRPLLRYDGLPAWLGVAVGYGANGMIGEFENITEYDSVAIPETVRYRQYLVSLDVDWTRIETRSRPLKAILAGLGFVKLPFPAVEITSQGDVRGRWLYF